jgi:hypothetical protein
MIVQTCTKRMPASVRQHPAGQMVELSQLHLQYTPVSNWCQALFPKSSANYPHFPYPNGFACSFLVPGITKAGTAITWFHGQGMRAKPAPG